MFQLPNSKLLPAHSVKIMQISSNDLPPSIFTTYAHPQLRPQVPRGTSSLSEADYLSGTFHPRTIALPDQTLKVGHTAVSQRKLTIQDSVGFDTVVLTAAGPGGPLIPAAPLRPRHIRGPPTPPIPASGNQALARRQAPRPPRPCGHDAVEHSELTRVARNAARSVAAAAAPATLSATSATAPAFVRLSDPGFTTTQRMMRSKERTAQMARTALQMEVRAPVRIAEHDRDDTPAGGRIARKELGDLHFLPTGSSLPY